MLDPRRHYNPAGAVLFYEDTHKGEASVMTAKELVEMLARDKAHAIEILAKLKHDGIYVAQAGDCLVRAQVMH